MTGVKNKIYYGSLNTLNLTTKLPTRIGYARGLLSPSPIQFIS